MDGGDCGDGNADAGDGGGDVRFCCVSECDEEGGQSEDVGTGGVEVGVAVIV